jgi:hypothetical protein
MSEHAQLVISAVDGGRKKDVGEIKIDIDRIIIGRGSWYEMKGGSKEEMYKQMVRHVSSGRLEFPKFASHVSRDHFQLVWDERLSRYFLTDLGSSYGTCVDNKKVTGPLKIEHGDIITIPLLDPLFEIMVLYPKKYLE